MWRDHQKISYERCVYETVDDKSLLYLKSLWKAELRNQRVTQLKL